MQINDVNLLVNLGPQDLSHHSMFSCRPVHDIHSVLEITVYDEYKEVKNRFIGRIAIPLIQVTAYAAEQSNALYATCTELLYWSEELPLIMGFQMESGVAKWYALKNAKLTSQVKGAILVEIDLSFNHVKT